jgi:hypothetical protein
MTHLISLGALAAAVALLAKRPDLCGVSPLTDALDQAARWTA